MFAAEKVGLLIPSELKQRGRISVRESEPTAFEMLM